MSSSVVRISGMSALAPKGVVTLTELAGMASCGTPVTEEVPHSRWSLDPLPADADDLSGITAGLVWLGMGKAPPTIVAESLLMSFGGTGLLVTALWSEVSPAA